MVIVDVILDLESTDSGTFQEIIEACTFASIPRLEIRVPVKRGMK